jgi:hypothetical protein
MSRDGSLPLAKHRLCDAVAGLCAPQWQDHRPLDPRYTQLRDAINCPALSGHHSGQPSSAIPAQIDALKLVMHIDDRTHVHTRFSQSRTTPNRLRELTQIGWRPQDCDQLTAVAGEIESWVCAIDDLFATPPIYLPDPCPHCAQTHTHRVGDDGERIRTPALALTVEKGATCQSCHDVWPPDRLLFLGRTLGYHPAGVTA